MDENRDLAQLTVPDTLHWRVTSDEEGLRLDAFLARHLSSFSRRERTSLIGQHNVLLNGRPAPKGTSVRREDRVTVTAPTEISPQPTLPIPILYVDDAIVVMNKPSGIPSLALRHSDRNTVANFLIAHFPETATAGPRQLEAGLVHRLDTETSGLLIAARTSHAYEMLRRQFQEHKVRKEYCALVEGGLTTTGQIAFPLLAVEERGQRMRIATLPKGQRALTLYAPLEQLPEHTLVRVTIVTGVRHQIRAHLAAIAHPIVGDRLYGPAVGAVHMRLCLHAETLACRHPLTGQELHFTSSIPEDFSFILERLQHRNSGDEKTTKRGKRE
jgi:23S rRNA pseudouridine1911/1915/1917 synthase